MNALAGQPEMQVVSGEGAGKESTRRAVGR